MKTVFTHTIAFSTETAHLLDLFKDEPGIFFLDSSLSENVDGRFSYLGFSPFKTIQAKTFPELKKAIKPYMTLRDAVPFSCGAVGSIAYDGQMFFGLYDGIICIDHHRQTLTISATGLPFKDHQRCKRQAQQKIDYVLYKLQNPGLSTSASKKLKKEIRLKSNTSKAEYVEAVKKALKNIYDGDIYQINLSHRFEATFRNWRKHTHPVKIYQQLRALSPSSFSAYLDQGEQIILSSSPERFLKLSQGIVEVRPMKGTRPRGEDVSQDQSNKQELIDSDKEKAELLMVTDLERNDLGRVCRYGSVHVKEMRTIEEYATVFQATATVQGELRKDCDAFDVLQSTFPSGSVTGCPKIEAMKIIRRLEKTKRGLWPPGWTVGQQVPIQVVLAHNP